MTGPAPAWPLPAARRLRHPGAGAGPGRPARRRRPPPARPASGPCRTPEPFALLPAPPYPSDVVVANFGLLMPAPAGRAGTSCATTATGWRPPDRVWRPPDGRLLAAGRAGLQPLGRRLRLDGRRRRSGGPSWSPTWPSIARTPEPDLGARQPARACSTARSTADSTFQASGRSPTASPIPRLLSAPSDGDRLYLVARHAWAPRPGSSPRDGGETWTEPGAHRRPRPAAAQPAAAWWRSRPTIPRALYFVIVDQDGDEIWKSADGGQSLTRVLELREGEVLGGFAFGATGATLFVAGTAPIVVDGRPPARLYRSTRRRPDLGRPIPSGADGPFFRCLTFAGGRLLACGAGETGGDRFLIGASPDEGRTWSPWSGWPTSWGPRPAPATSASPPRPGCATSTAAAASPPDGRGRRRADPRRRHGPPAATGWRLRLPAGRATVRVRRRAAGGAGAASLLAGRRARSEAGQERGQAGELVAAGVRALGERGPGSAKSPAQLQPDLVVGADRQARPSAWPRTG